MRTPLCLLLALAACGDDPAPHAPRADVSRIDHLILAAPTLERGIAAMEERFGVRATLGGSHAGLGTQNALLALGAHTYLEILAPDPAQGNCPGLSAELKTLPEPALFTWVYQSTDLAALSVSKAGQGLTAIGPVGVTRVNAHGDKLSWELLFFTGHAHGQLLPFAIDWGTTPHPATTAPLAAELVDFEIQAPKAEELTALVGDFGPRIVASSEPGLRATLVADGHDVALASSPATMAIRSAVGLPAGPCIP